MIYFDNSATTYPKPDAFYEKLSENFRKFGLNGSRSKYKKASLMKDLENDLRIKLASDKYFNISNPQNLIITPSATFSINQVLQGLDYSNIKNVYISPFEHNAIYRTILYLQKKYKFELEFIPFNKFVWDKNKTKLYFKSKSPDLVILNHASNVFGNILPVSDIFSLAKKVNAITVLDVAQSAGSISVNMKKLNADFACFAGHKGLYGPTGIGGFAINSNIKLTPILFGGTGINSEEINMPLYAPERFEVGSMNSLGIIGLTLSLKWIEEVNIDKIYKKKQESLKILIETLSRYDEINIISDSKNNIGVVSIIIDDYTPQDFAIFLNEKNIAIRDGLHCAPIAHNHIGTAPNGTVRFSLGFFNDNNDFENLDKALNEIL